MKNIRKLTLICTIFVVAIERLKICEAAVLTVNWLIFRREFINEIRLEKEKVED
jgi:hypothetical protein